MDERKRPARPRGRRPAGSDTRAAILRAARRQFSELGFRDATLRGIGAAAGVDARLVLHYFGSKRELFMASVELPFDEQMVLTRAFDGPPEGVARRVVGLFLDLFEETTRRAAFLAILRAATSEPEAAAAIRGVLTDRLLLPVARRVGGSEPELRASLLASQLVGLALTRYVVGLEPLVEASRERLADALAPVVDHYLRGVWVASDGGRAGGPRTEVAEGS